MDRTRQVSVLGTMALLLLTAGPSARVHAANEPPVAEAGLPRYAATAPVRLDGTGSYDPDNSGSLTYAWTQISGPALTVSNGNTATPTISGFVQSGAVQECTFTLVVSDGAFTSRPDTVGVIIVPLFGAATVRLENASFDPEKPTFIYFGGGDCVVGQSGQPWNGGLAWTSKANVLDFPEGYAPDPGGGPPTYYRYADMIITYLSAVAPNYRELIQTAGWSTGGQPAIDVAVRLNTAYQDAGYAVNRVSLLDATPYCRESYQESIDRVVTCTVDGEQCWIDNYASTLLGSRGDSTYPSVKNNVLNVWFDRATDTFLPWLTRHNLADDWYRYSGSMAAQDANRFNHGVVGGAYWSVIGPGKNLRLGAMPSTPTYHFKWYGDALSGHMELYDELNRPARLPEPVILGAWAGTDASGAVDGAVLSCHESENAVGYQLLFGSDPYSVMDYQVVSDTPQPPNRAITTLPFPETWWTVRARDAYGCMIHADPLRVDAYLLSLPIENTARGKRYLSLQTAIDEASAGDEIVVRQGTCQENIIIKDKPLTLRSTDPNNPVVVAGTIIRGQAGNPTVTFSGPERGGCVLAGLTIQSGTVGVSCRDAVPTIRNCVVECPNGIAMEFWHGRRPELIGGTVVGQVKEGGDPGLVAYWKLDETQGITAHDGEGKNDATVIGAPLWRPGGGKVDGALELSGMASFVTAKAVRNPSAGPLSVFAWVKGGAPGQVILSQAGGANWLMAGTGTGALASELKESGPSAKPLVSATIITDGTWHHVGFTWDSANRVLYVDDVEVARDTQAALAGSTGNLTIGAGSTLAPASFWKGLIDDVRIYDRAVKP